MVHYVFYKFTYWMARRGTQDWLARGSPHGQRGWWRRPDAVATVALADADKQLLPLQPVACSLPRLCCTITYQKEGDMHRLLLLVAALYASPLQAQQVIRIDRSTCSSCSIVFRQAVTIGSPDDPFAFDLRGTALAMHSSGQFWIASVVSPGEIAVYNPDGSYSHAIGRSGRGPGEYRVITRLRSLPDGTMAAMDQGNGRIALVRADGGVEYLNLPGLLYDVVEDGRNYIVQAYLTVPGAAGKYLHRVTSDGQVLESFAPAGGPVSEYLARAPRAVAAMGQHGLLIADRARYRITEFDRQGTARRILDRDVPWFQPWLEPKRGQPVSIPPDPVLADMKVDADGLLWVLHHVRARNWQPGSLNDPGERMPSDNYDSVIEVIDPASQSLIANARTPHFIQRLLTPTSGFALRRMSDGNVVADVWHFILQRR
jgi:hypothetical protein